jgi:hypothetical protein
VAVRLVNNAVQVPRRDCCRVAAAVDYSHQHHQATPKGDWQSWILVTSVRCARFFLGSHSLKPESGFSVQDFEVV